MKNKIISISVILLLIVGFTGIAGASAVYPSISTDKTDYGPNDPVAITGTGFTPSGTITLTISVPDGLGTTDKTEVTADGDGKFVVIYQLIDGIQDMYNVTAVEGINTATTSFTDDGGMWFLGNFWYWGSSSGSNYNHHGSFCQPKNNIPEFPTVALPVAAVIGLVFFFQQKKNKKE